MTIFTKIAAAIFAAVDSGGAARMIDCGEVATWGTELEGAITGLVGKGPAVVANRTQLKALDTSVYPNAYVAEGARNGHWYFEAGDASSVVVTRTFSSSSISGDQVTCSGHRIEDGDCFILAAAANGLLDNTYYYGRRVDGDAIKISDSRVNAIDGITLTLTGTSPMTFKVVPDDLEGTVVLKPGADLDGSGGAWLRVGEAGDFNASHFGCIRDNSADNASAIRCAMHLAEETGGGSVSVPAGDIYMLRGLIARRLVRLKGKFKQSTTFKYHGNSAAYALDCLDDGSDGAYPYDRTICGFEHFTIDASNIDPASNLVGIRTGGNHRSSEMFSKVKVAQTPHYGLELAADNWNVDYGDLEIDTCGRLRSNSCGIYKDPAVTDINANNFRNVRVEGSGNVSSAAGGWFLSTTTLATNRGWLFSGCQAEGNFGTDECYFSNLRGVYINGFYIEAVYTTNAMEINNCVGHIHGAQVTGANATQHNALYFTGSSKFSVMDLQTYASFQNYDILAQDTAEIVTANLDGASTHTAGSATINGM